MSEIITFNLEQQEAEFILNTLAQLPYVQSAGIIAKLQQQAQECFVSCAQQTSSFENTEK